MMILTSLNDFFILFADDIVLCITNADLLQALMDKIAQYSRTWGLKIIINKTKKMYL